MKSKKVNWGHVIVFIILILCMIVTLLRDCEKKSVNKILL